MGRVVSIDFGLKRLGVAISDESKIIATSLGCIFAGKTLQETINSLLELLKKYPTLERIIIGKPMHLNGEAGSLLETVQQFATLLESQVSCPVSLYDERLSTVQAERSLREGGMRRKERAKVIDAVTATLLLQCYLGY